MKTNMTQLTLFPQILQMPANPGTNTLKSVQLLEFTAPAWLKLNQLSSLTMTEINTTIYRGEGDIEGRGDRERCRLKLKQDHCSPVYLVS